MRAAPRMASAIKLQRRGNTAKISAHLLWVPSCRPTLIPARNSMNMGTSPNLVQFTSEVHNRLIVDEGDYFFKNWLDVQDRSLQVDSIWLDWSVFRNQNPYWLSANQFLETSNLDRTQPKMNPTCCSVEENKASSRPVSELAWLNLLCFRDYCQTSPQSSLNRYTNHVQSIVEIDDVI